MNEKYLRTDAATLAIEQDFISWVKNDAHGEEWSKWIKEHPDQDKKVKEARQIVLALQFDTTQLPVNKEMLWKRIDESTSGTIAELANSTKQTRRYYIGAFAAIAASFLLLFAVMPLLRQSNTITVSPGESITHVLPDNSKVYINANSQITYDKRDFGSDRVLELDGEAFFEVEKGSNFKVKTDNGSVQVLGTQFNVYSRGSSFNVKCTEGRVRVSTKRGKQKEVLEAGDVVRLTDDLALERIPFKAKYDWRREAYSYERIPLSDVFEEIERQFDISITASPQIMSMSFTGPLETKDLDKALYMVTWPMSLEYTLNGNEVVITRNQ